MTAAETGAVDPPAEPGEAAGPRRRARRLPWWLLALLSVGAAYSVTRLRNAAELACDVGINAGMATTGSIAAGILLLLMDLAGVSLLRLIPHRGLAALLVVYLLAGTSWVFLASTGPPEGYPNTVEICVENVPDWWPAWLPSGG